MGAISAPDTGAGAGEREGAGQRAGGGLTGRTFAKIMIITRRITDPKNIMPSTDIHEIPEVGAGGAAEAIYYNKTKI